MLLTPSKNLAQKAKPASALRNKDHHNDQGLNSQQAWCRARQQQHTQRWNMETTETHSKDKREADSKPETGTQSKRQDRYFRPPQQDH